MIIEITEEAETDLLEGYWFYERQSPGLGNYFRSCLISDLDSLEYYAGIHEVDNGFHRALAKRFPFCIYYLKDGDRVLIVAILDAKRSPLWIRNRLGN